MSDPSIDKVSWPNTTLSNHVLETLDDLTRNAMFAAGHFATTNQTALDYCTPAGRDALIIRCAVAYLLANGLITVVPEATEQWLPDQLEGPYASHLQEKLKEALASRASIDAALRRPQ
jgi:hypothetical protein